MKKELKNTVEGVITTVEVGVNTIEKKIDHAVAPTRKSFFKRFPIISVLLVTFGVSSTFLGFERIIIETPYLFERPYLILSIGIGVLVLTGTLYKKLG